MIVINLIKGLSFGFEYVDHEEYGFIVNLDLGILRFQYFKDIEMDE